MSISELGAARLAGVGLERDQGTHSSAGPAFAGCAFVVGLVTLSYRVAQWLSSASADGSIRVSSGAGMTRRQLPRPACPIAPAASGPEPASRPTSPPGSSQRCTPRKSATVSPRCAERGRARRGSRNALSSSTAELFQRPRALVWPDLGKLTCRIRI